MLNGAGNTQSDIDLGTNGLTGLADLMISREPTSIHSGTAAAYYAAAQGLGQLLGQLDASGNILTDAAADRNDDLGAGQIDQILGRLDDLQNLGLQVGSRQLDGMLLDNDLISLGLVEGGALHNAGTNGRHLGTEAGADDGRHQVAAECGTGHLQVGALIELHVVHIHGGGGL